MAVSEKQKAADRTAAVADLARYVTEDQRVFGMVTSVSGNGMSRKIKLFVVLRDDLYGDDVVDVTRLVAKATGYRYDEKTETLIVRGAGFNVVGSVVSDLAHVMFDSPLALSYRVL